MGYTSDSRNSQSTGTSTLFEGEILLENEILESINEKYFAMLQSDGNFVVYRVFTIHIQKFDYNIYSIIFYHINFIKFYFVLFIEFNIIFTQLNIT